MGDGDEDEEPHPEEEATPTPEEGEEGELGSSLFFKGSAVAGTAPAA